MRILVADDQPGVLEAARFLLKSEGHTTVTAESPQAVLQLTSGPAADTFDLILIDLNYARDTTSGQEGLDLLAALKGAGVRSPVVVMTAWGSVDLAVEAMRRGASDFVQKPWDNTRLLDTITKQVARARASRSDLDIARTVQAKLLPSGPPAINGLDCAGRCIPALGIGGDYFDWFDLPDGRLGFVLADVSGKGIAAALLMAHLHGAFRGRLSLGLPSATELLQDVNRQFWESSPSEHYATLFYGVWEPLHRQLTWLNAGHLPGLLLRSGNGLEHLESSALPLGMFAHWTSEAQTTTLLPGDTLLVYSDGVVEAGVVGRGEEFGEERLVNEGREAACLSAAGLVDRICSRVIAWDDVQHDDCTLVALRAT